MPQAEMSLAVTKASWTTSGTSTLGDDVSRALQAAGAGRPGPVHVSLPVDVLESVARTTPEAHRESAPSQPPSAHLDDDTAGRILDLLAQSRKPLVLAGPCMMRRDTGDLRNAFARSTKIPLVGMESPRGVNDPSLGAFAQVLAEADMVLLLAKRLDFALRWQGKLALSTNCHLMQLDPDFEVLELSRRVLDDPSRLLIASLADPAAALERLVRLAGQRQWPESTWNNEVHSAISFRPPEWRDMKPSTAGPLHAVEISRAVQAYLGGGEDAVFISDGGEFGQWAQACVQAPRRLINGPSGSIGSAIPFALAARLAAPETRIVTMLGDGSAGFHLLEFDTAVRYGLPFVAVVGNDASWNAEYQLQLRKFGAERAIGCDLLPTRYDRVAAAMGGHGEHVSRSDELAAALERAHRSGLPACVNVPLMRNAAPTYRSP
jgi:acetolactate synthase-1/2/3 large subunit